MTQVRSTCPPNTLIEDSWLSQIIFISIAQPNVGAGKGLMASPQWDLCRKCVSMPIKKNVSAGLIVVVTLKSQKRRSLYELGHFFYRDEIMEQDVRPCTNDLQPETSCTHTRYRSIVVKCGLCFFRLFWRRHPLSLLRQHDQWFGDNSGVDARRHREDQVRRRRAP